MKIAIISSLFYESTFPLAKHLSEENPVDLFCFISKTFLTMPMMDLSRSIANESGFVDDIHSLSLLPENVSNYFINTNVKIHLVILTGGRNVFSDLIALSMTISKIKNEKYSIIHFVGDNFYFTALYPFLNKFNKIHTFHENYSRSIKSKNKLKKILIKKLYNQVVSSDASIILHSENVKKLFLFDFKNFNENRISIIPFGLFEGYKYFNGSVKIETANNPYILFFGYIVDYKGVDVLINSILKLNNKGIFYDCIIAGRDNIGININSLPNNIRLINRFLTEDEIVYLIKQCKFVVMPYKTASQSGIPNTAFIFNKPIIASKIEGIEEIIKDKINGLLFEPSNSSDLANKIHELYVETDLYSYLINNIRNLNHLENLEWKEIAIRTLDLYQKAIACK